MRRIFWRELMERKWSLFWYSFAAVALLWIYAATFKSSLASTQQLLQVIKSYPKALIDAFGLNSLAGTTIEQYLNGKHFSFVWPLMAILLAMSRAGSAFAGEIQDRTMGLLLALPVKRLGIFAGKYLAGIAGLAAFTVLSIFPVIPLAKAYGVETHPHVLIGTWMLTMLFAWAVYSFGVLVSCFFTDRSRVYAIAGSLILLSYMANIVSLLADKLSSLKYFSLFHYFDTAASLSSGNVGRSAIAVFVLITAVSTAVAAWQFNRRDVQV